MSYNSQDFGCDGCDFSWRYFLNGLNPCPDAYTDKSIYCGNYNHKKKRDNDGSTRTETDDKEQ